MSEYKIGSRQNPYVLTMDDVTYLIVEGRDGGEDVLDRLDRIYVDDGDGVASRADYEITSDESALTRLKESLGFRKTELYPLRLPALIKYWGTIQSLGDFEAELARQFTPVGASALVDNRVARARELGREAGVHFEDINAHVAAYPSVRIREAELAQSIEDIRRLAASGQTRLMHAALERLPHWRQALGVTLESEAHLIRPHLDAIRACYAQGYGESLILLKQSLDAPEGSAKLRSSFSWLTEITAAETYATRSGLAAAEYQPALAEVRRRAYESCRKRAEADAAEANLSGMSEDDISYLADIAGSAVPKSDVTKAEKGVYGKAYAATLKQATAAEAGILTDGALQGTLRILRRYGTFAGKAEATVDKDARQIHRSQADALFHAILAKADETASENVIADVKRMDRLLWAAGLDEAEISKRHQAIGVAEHHRKLFASSLAECALELKFEFRIGSDRINKAFEHARMALSETPYESLDAMRSALSDEMERITHLVAGLETRLGARESVQEAKRKLRALSLCITGERGFYY